MPTFFYSIQLADNYRNPIEIPHLGERIGCVKPTARNVAAICPPKPFIPY
jgi:hypothetical protein